MPWREKETVTLREDFVLRAMQPDVNMSELCRDFGISRKTGYKWKRRFQETGIEGLVDRSKRPHSSPLRVSGEVVLRVVELRRAHVRWGPKKIRAVLARSLPAGEVPSLRTVARIIERAGLSKPRRRSRTLTVSRERPAPTVQGPNDLWTVDFKGWWKTGDGRRAEPLTVRDAFSRYVLCAELLDSTATARVLPQFEHLFERYGLPGAIQVDNGSPFGSTRAPGGLTRLSAWWVSLGVAVVRGRPAHPEDNGAHERMHLDMRFDVEDVPADDIEAQKIALGRWLLEFNHVRPHEALDMATPASLYRKSTRRYLGIRKAWYPSGFELRRVNKKGFVKYRGRSRYVSLALQGYAVAVRALDDTTAELRFYDLDLGRLEIAV